MPFNNTSVNPDDLVAPEWFVNAKALISSSKGWKKWPKVVSRPVYERICEDLRLFAEKVGVEERMVTRFKTGTLDYYIEHGTLMPCRFQYNVELGLLALFKRRIDESILRRVRAIRAAALRRERKEALKKMQTQSPDEALQQSGMSAHEESVSSTSAILNPVEKQNASSMELGQTSSRGQYPFAGIHHPAVSTSGSLSGSDTSTLLPHLSVHLSG